MKASKFWLLLLLLFCACSAPRQTVERPRIVEKQPLFSDPLKKVRRGLIVIDPGHGGEDHGTKSLVKPIYLEKYLNLTTAKFLATYLEQMGYQTLLTRKDDTFIPLKTRAEFANERHPMLFLSVHYNAAPSAEARGIEIFYFKSDKDKGRTEASKKLAATILKELLGTTHATSRGVKPANFAVIRETDMPAVLIEGGFLSNTEELERLKDPAYLKKIAWGIAQGVDKYVLGAS